MKILFLTPYPHGEAPSQRFRFEQYVEVLESNGFECEFSPFFDKKTWKVLYKKGYFFNKFVGVLSGFLNRLVILFRLADFDFVFIHREASPIGPPALEWAIAKVFRKRIIYDFDDAIWLPNSSESNRIFAFLKRYDNAFNIMDYAYKVSCGNKYLCDVASSRNPSTVFNPTTIDTEKYHNQIKSYSEGKVVIGWTGSHSTVRYLDLLLPVFRRLENKYDFELCVISDHAPDFKLRSLKFVEWNKETEIEDLLHFDLGIMPLDDDKWAKGKCGFKALQYMALGIPALVSPVGVNTEIVDHGLNGLICKTSDDWFNCLEKLILDKEEIKKLGANSRKKIIDQYSVRSNEANFLHLFS